MAENLGKTVDELLTGKASPISNAELLYWVAYRVVKQELVDEENKKVENGSSSSLDGSLPRGMGQQ